MHGIGYHQGISHSQSQELIKKQISSNNGLFSIQKTQGGQDPNSLFQLEIASSRRNNDNFLPFSPVKPILIASPPPTQLALLCQFLASTLQQERQTVIPPQYHLDQNVIHQEILQKAAAAELY